MSQPGVGGVLPRESAGERPRPTARRPMGWPSGGLCRKVRSPRAATSQIEITVRAEVSVATMERRDGPAGRSRAPGVVAAGGGPLPARYPEAHAEGEAEVERDDREIEGGHGGKE